MIVLPHIESAISHQQSYYFTSVYHMIYIHNHLVEVMTSSSFHFYWILRISYSHIKINMFVACFIDMTQNYSPQIV